LAQGRSAADPWRGSLCLTGCIYRSIGAHLPLSRTWPPGLPVSAACSPYLAGSCELHSSAMLVSCKRPSYEEWLEPIFKRCRVDVAMAMAASEDGQSCSQDPVLAASGSRDPVLAACVAERRRHSMDDFQEAEHPSKRLCLGGASVGDGADPCPGDAGAAGQGEATVKRWAEGIVRALHGCPSMEEATGRCSQALLEFGAEVRQATLREAEAAAPEMHEERVPEATQSLQHTNKVLMRAVHHLAERCRRLEASAGEVAAVRQELEQSQEQQRRLLHSNAVLQEHLKVHLNHGCR